MDRACFDQCVDCDFCLFFLLRESGFRVRYSARISRSGEVSELNSDLVVFTQPSAHHIAVIDQSTSHSMPYSWGSGRPFGLRTIHDRTIRSLSPETELRTWIIMSQRSWVDQVLENFILGSEWTSHAHIAIMSNGKRTGTYWPLPSWPSSTDRMRLETVARRSALGRHIHRKLIDDGYKVGIS